MIELNNVSMKFRMANDRIMSLKEYLLKKIAGKLQYKEFTALKDISFSIKKGEVVGIIGGNGAGKSTMLKIVSGILTPTQGRVKVDGNIAPLLELGAGFDMDLSAKENIYLNGAVLGYSKQYLTEKYDEIVDFSELQEFMDVPIRNFSSGMTARLAFSIATLVNPDVLIVDEILSVGDAQFQQKSASRMRELINGGATVILVSHSIEQIREICTRVIWLDHGEVKMIGNMEEVCSAYISYAKGGKSDPDPINPLIYREKLYSPTFIAKYNNDYFIVDCWHHRVIYNENLIDPIKKWKTLAGSFSNPHSIASDGEVFLVEDTKYDRVKVLRRKGTSFVETQSIGNIGSQPNKIIYDLKNKRFFGIAASSQQVFTLKNKGNEVIVEKIIKLDYLKTAYVRAISFIDEKIYFVSGPGKIIAAQASDLTFDLIEEFIVPFELQGMNDIAKIGSYYYLSVYQNGAGDITPKLVRTKDLNELQNNNYEDLNDQLSLTGVPYNISFLDDRIFLTEIDSHSSIKSFKVVNDIITDLQVHYDIGKPDESSLKRRKMG
ncbi:ATP-binding cassette domain-containing protein [Paenibacillus mesophilus]|uniref:ATP-binding cassette domain-containing protein n=1 Tax=Paenibacillus mesophilus TaxID=2582849 RepID=UPI001EE3C0F9|nr:ATP-binding cassette domain-containing protein [Paenibacillus mesophilus]